MELTNTSGDMSSTTTNNYLSLLIPSLKRHANEIIIRPHQGTAAVPSWGQLTFQEWDRQLAVAKSHWKEALSSMCLRPGDVIGVWYADPTC